MIFRDEREQKGTIGVNESELSKIVQSFSEILQARRMAKNRKRVVGGGRRGALPTNRDKVIFCLYYLKNYPTFDDLGNRFQLSRSCAHTALHKWAPFLLQALEKLDVLPQSVFKTPEMMAEYFEKKRSTVC